MGKEVRYFMVTNVRKPGQKNEKGNEKKTKGYGLVLKGSTPGSAAKKAMTELCKRKEYHGMCALRVVLTEVETTNGGSPSKKEGHTVPMKYKDGRVKEFAYRLQKRRLKEPITVMINGTPVVYKYKSIVRSDLNKPYKSVSTKSKNSR